MMPVEKKLMKKAQRNLQKYFGYRQFYPFQKKILKHVFEGNNVLTIVPTGGGKSLCFQIPALCFSGLVLVVSPLISLMKDQVDKLQSHGVKAAYLNSSQSRRERKEVLNNILADRYDILYVAPERFQVERFVDLMKKTTISLLAVDEVHCVSEWGHDFRPDYLQLGHIKEELGADRILGVTATATKEVRKDIAKKLRLESYNEMVEGVKRDNLFLTVHRMKNEEEKNKKLIEYLQNTIPAIVYAGTRKKTDELTEMLNDELDYNAVGYHGGMSSDQRKKIQELFMRGQREIIVATNAFGMGVDKSNIRLIVHYQLPENLESYYQQAGRAGRDGKESQCVLFYCPDDEELIEFFINSSYPEPNVIRKVARWISRWKKKKLVVNFRKIREDLSFSIDSYSLTSVFTLLCRSGYLEKIRQQGYNEVYRIKQEINHRRLKNIDFARQVNLKQKKFEKLEKLIEYAINDDCRHRYILDYFDSDEDSTCPGCDNCNDAREIKGELPAKKKAGIKMLKCISRLENKFGLVTVAQVLAGSEAEKVKRHQLNKIEEYGYLDNLTQKKVRKMLKKLISAGYFVKTGGKYPLVTLTSAGREVINGARDIEVEFAFFEQ